MAKILAILTSKRPDGNTNRMVQAASEGAKSAGATVTTIDLTKQKIEDVYYSQKTSDGFEKLAQQFNSADGYIIGCPNYWDNMPAKLKLFFDRLTPHLVETGGRFLKPKHRGKKFIVLTSCYDHPIIDHLSSGSWGTYKSVKTILRQAGMAAIGYLNYSESKGKIHERKGELGKSRKLGALLARKIGSKP